MTTTPTADTTHEVIGRNDHVTVAYFNNGDHARSWAAAETAEGRPSYVMIYLKPAPTFR